LSPVSNAPLMAKIAIVSKPVTATAAPMAIGAPHHALAAPSTHRLSAILVSGRWLDSRA